MGILGCSDVCKVHCCVTRLFPTSWQELLVELNTLVIALSPATSGSLQQLALLDLGYGITVHLSSELLHKLPMTHVSSGTSLALQLSTCIPTLHSVWGSCSEDVSKQDGK